MAWVCVGVLSAIITLSNFKIVFGLSTVGRWLPNQKPQFQPHEFRAQWQKIIANINKHPNVLKVLHEAVHGKSKDAVDEKKPWNDDMGDIPDCSEEE